MASITIVHQTTTALFVHTGGAGDPASDHLAVPLLSKDAGAAGATPQGLMLATLDTDVVKLTDVSVQVWLPWTYACLLKYRYNCLHHTTLGPQICLAASVPWALRLLQRYAYWQERFWRWYGYVIMFAASAVVQVLSISAPVPPAVIALVLLPCIAFLVVTLALDGVLLYQLEGGMQVAWNVGMQVPVPRCLFDPQASNEFIKLERERLRLALGTDFSTHVLAMQLQRFPVLTFMLYTRAWKARFVPFSFELVDCSSFLASRAEWYFWIASGWLLEMCCALHLLFTVPGGEGALSTAGSGFAGWVVFLVFYNWLARYAYNAINVVLCCLPAWLARRVHGTWQDELVAKAMAAAQEGQAAPRLQE